MKEPSLQNHGLIRQEEWPVSENVLKAKSPKLPNWTAN